MKGAWFARMWGGVFGRKFPASGEGETNGTGGEGAYRDEFKLGRTRGYGTGYSFRGGEAEPNATGFGDGIGAGAGDKDNCGCGSGSDW